MLTMMPVIADYMFKMFLTFYILQAGLPNVVGPRLTYPPTLPLDGPGCVNKCVKKN